MFSETFSLVFVIVLNYVGDFLISNLHGSLWEERNIQQKLNHKYDSPSS